MIDKEWDNKNTFIKKSFFTVLNNLILDKKYMIDQRWSIGSNSNQVLILDDSDREHSQQHFFL